MPPILAPAVLAAMSFAAAVSPSESNGGFAGGDGRCLDFFQQRTDETLLWRDPRRQR